MREIQADFMKFVLEAWGPESTQRAERARRFLEEAAELAQAIGVEPAEMWRIFDRVIQNKKGQLSLTQLYSRESDTSRKQGLDVA